MANEKGPQILRGVESEAEFGRARIHPLTTGLIWSGWAAKPHTVSRMPLPAHRLRCCGL